MKQQWVQFLDDNSANWSYGIVPELVHLLAQAQKTGDIGLELYALYGLRAQGIRLDKNGDLCFTIDLILNNTNERRNLK